MTDRGGGLPVDPAVFELRVPSAWLAAALARVQDLEAERRRLVCGILAVRDAFHEGDESEAYHQLYAIANPEFDSFTPWKEFEELVGRVGE